MSETVQKPAETAAGSPGAILKRCREYHDITLEEASETTKIGISHLAALEGDQIREFANRVYLKGFLRIYAAYLGLNSDDLSRMYDKLYGVTSEMNEMSEIGSTVSETTRPNRRLMLLKKLVFPGILLLLVLITATFFKRPSPPRIRPAQPVAVAVTAPPVSAVQPSRSSAKSETSAPLMNASKAETRPAAKPEPEAELHDTHPVDTSKGFVLKIKVTQNGTMTATVDGLGVQNYDLIIGDIIEWKAERDVALELSNAGGVEIELNGKPYKQLGPAGKSAYIEFDAEGVRP